MFEMNQFGIPTSYQFRQSLPSSNPYTTNYNNLSSLNEKMDNFWCHDVPDNMPEAFNIVQTNLNQNSNSLFRFTGNNLPNSLNNPSSLSHNWETIGNLDQASDSIKPQKRKCGLEVEEDDLVAYQPPSKQSATEEKVIGKLNRLTIDESFDDQDEFILALEGDMVNDEELAEVDGFGRDDIIEVETDDVLNDKQIQFEITDEAKEFWNYDDVITKMVKNQREKDAKALVLWQPKITPFLDHNKSDNESDDDSEKKGSKTTMTTKVVDQDSEYTVIEEIDDEIKDDTKSPCKDDNNGFKLEIIELDEINEVDVDEDMMET